MVPSQPRGVLVIFGSGSLGVVDARARCFRFTDSPNEQPEGCVAVAGSLTMRFGLSLTQRRSLGASRAHLPPLLMLLQLMLMLLPPLHWLRVALLLLLALQCALQMALLQVSLLALLRPLLLTP